MEGTPRARGTLESVAPWPSRTRRFASPYARYNLRRNPFGELSREERAELAVVEVHRFAAELADRKYVVQFIGECGEGKTTHLLALWTQLSDTHYVYLPEDGPLPEIPSTRPLLIDEAQRLSRRERRRIFSTGGGLALGTHEDFRGELTRAGLHVDTIRVGTDHSPERLAAILNARIAASRISAEAQIPEITLATALEIQRTVGFNFRRIEQFLYEQFQEAAQKGTLWPIVR